MAKVCDLGGGQDALLAIDAKAGVVKASEHFSQIGNVLRERLTSHQDVVQVNKHPFHITQNAVH